MPFLVRKEGASKQKLGDTITVKKNLCLIRVYSNDVVLFGASAFDVHPHVSTASLRDINKEYVGVILVTGEEHPLT